MTAIMSKAENATVTLDLCARWLRSYTVNGPLAHLLSVIYYLHRQCPFTIQEGMARITWLRLLDRVPRACERQLCAENENVVPWAVHVVE